MRGTEFADLKSFVAVADHKSFSRAAEALQVSPSALSQTIRALEERLGVRLFHRTTRSVTVTEAGRRLFRRVAPLFGEFHAAIDEVSSFQKTPKGVLRIRAPQMAVVHLLQPILPQFQESYPEVVLDITSEDADGDMVAQGFDAAIRLGEAVEKDLVAVRLGPDLRQIAVASPEYVARHGKPETPADLVNHRCINWRQAGRTVPYRWEFARDGEWFEVAVTGSLIVNDCAVALRAAIDGLGITVWTEEWMQRELQNRRLVALLSDWSPPFPGFHLCYPSRRQMLPALKALVDTVRKSNRVGTTEDTVTPDCC